MVAVTGIGRVRVRGKGRVTGGRGQGGRGGRGVIVVAPQNDENRSARSRGERR